MYPSVRNVAVHGVCIGRGEHVVHTEITIAFHVRAFEKILARSYMLNGSAAENAGVSGSAAEND